MNRLQIALSSFRLLPTWFHCKERKKHPLCCFVRRWTSSQTGRYAPSTFLEPLRTWGGRTISTCWGRRAATTKTAIPRFPPATNTACTPTRDWLSRLSRRSFRHSQAHSRNACREGLCSRPNASPHAKQYQPKRFTFHPTENGYSVPVKYGGRFNNCSYLRSLWSQQVFLHVQTPT
jgi:hypothetical protein